MTANTGAATADKSSKLSHSLRKHRRTHQNNYKDNCTHCPKLFPGKDHLVLHGRLHDCDNTNTNPCPRMQSEVQNKKTLTGHLKTHSTDKPHKCDSCDSAFTRKSNLTRHVLAAHTGPVFHCDICLAPFELNQRLKVKALEADHNSNAIAQLGHTVYKVTMMPMVTTMVSMVLMSTMMP